MIPACCASGGGDAKRRRGRRAMDIEGGASKDAKGNSEMTLTPLVSGVENAMRSWSLLLGIYWGISSDDLAVSCVDQPHAAVGVPCRFNAIRATSL